jgi:hypothetical protein
VAANRMPAAAGYLRRPGDTKFRAFKLDVMRMESGLIAEVTVFNAELFPAFGLPPALLAGAHGQRRAQNMAVTSDSERTTAVPSGGTFPSSSPRTICTAAMPRAAAPAQYDG